MDTSWEEPSSFLLDGPKTAGCGRRTSVFCEGEGVGGRRTTSDDDRPAPSMRESLMARWMSSSGSSGVGPVRSMMEIGSVSPDARAESNPG